MKLTDADIARVKELAHSYFIHDTSHKPDDSRDFVAKCYIKATIALLVKNGVLENDEVEFLSRPMCESLDD